MKKKACLLRLFVLPLLVLFLLSSCTDRYEPNRENNKDDSGSHTVLPGDGNSFYDSLHDTPSESVRLFPDITHERVKELLSAVVPPERYCWYYTTTLCSSAKNLTRNGILIYGGGDCKIEVYNEGSILYKTVSLRGGSLFTEQNGVETELPSDKNSVFTEAGVVSLSSFLEDSGEDFSYTLAESDYGTLLFASFAVEKGSYRQTQEYYISLDYGIVVRADCYENDTLIYHLETNALYELSDSAEQLDSALS